MFTKIWQRIKAWRDSFLDKWNNAHKAPLALDVVTVSVPIRIIGSIVAGISVAFGFYLVLGMTILVTPLQGNPLGFYTTFLLAVLLTVAFSRSYQTEEKEGKKFELIVPPTKFAAQLLWFGIPIPAYLNSGEYPWIGKSLGFSVSRKVVDVFTDENGFIRMDTIPFRVWDDADAPEGDERRTFITAPSRNNALMKGALTLEVRVEIPRRVLDVNQPAVTLGDRSRQEWRETVGKFVDTDVPKLAAALNKVFRGFTLITSFLGLPDKHNKAGAMIRDKQGKPMYEIFEGETDEELRDAEREFAESVVSKAKTDMRKQVWKEVELVDVETGEVTKTGRKGVMTEHVKVENPIKEVLDNIGCVLDRVSVADLDFSDDVKKAASLASAEQDERIAQLASAKTIKAARRELMPTKAEENRPGFELATILAAAQDDKSGSIRVVMVPGGNSLTSAAIAGASQIEGGGS